MRLLMDLNFQLGTLAFAVVGGVTMVRIDAPLTALVFAPLVVIVIAVRVLRRAHRPLPRAVPPRHRRRYQLHRRAVRRHSGAAGAVRRAARGAPLRAAQRRPPAGRDPRPAPDQDPHLGLRQRGADRRGGDPGGGSRRHRRRQLHGRRLLPVRVQPHLSVAAGGRRLRQLPDPSAPGRGVAAAAAGDDGGRVCGRPHRAQQHAPAWAAARDPLPSQERGRSLREPHPRRGFL